MWVGKLTKEKEKLPEAKREKERPQIVARIATYHQLRAPARTIRNDFPVSPSPPTSFMYTQLQSDTC